VRRGGRGAHCTVSDDGGGRSLMARIRLHWDDAGVCTASSSCSH